MVGVFSLGYILGGLFLGESMAEGKAKVKIIHYTDHLIKMELYTPVKIKKEARQRHDFRQMGDDKYLLHLWYNQ